MSKNSKASISNRDELAHITSLIVRYGRNYPKKVIQNLKAIGWSDREIARDAFKMEYHQYKRQFMGED